MHIKCGGTQTMHINLNVKLPGSRKPCIINLKVMLLGGQTMCYNKLRKLAGKPILNLISSNKGGVGLKFIWVILKVNDILCD